MPSLFSLFVDLKANTADFVSGMSTASYAAKKAGHDIEDSFSRLGDVAGVALRPFGELGAAISETLSRVGEYAASASEQFAHLGSGMSKFAVSGGLAAGAMAAVGAGAIGVAIETAKSADEMFHLAESSGVAVETLSKLSFIAKQYDIDQETLAKGLQLMSVRMEQTATQGPNVVSVFDRMGLSVRNSNGTLKDASTMFSEIIGKLQEMQDRTAAVGLSRQIFGRQAGSDMLRLNTEGIEHWSQVAEQVGAVVTDHMGKAAHDFQTTLNTIEEAAKGASNQLEGQLLPALQQVADALTSTASSKNFVTELAETVAGTLAVINTLWSGIEQTWMSGVFTITELGNALVTPWIAATEAMEGHFSQAWSEMEDGAKNVVELYRWAAQQSGEIWTDNAAFIKGATPKPESKFDIANDFFKRTAPPKDTGEANLAPRTQLGIPPKDQIADLVAKLAEQSSAELTLAASIQQTVAAMTLAKAADDADVKIGEQRNQLLDQEKTLRAELASAQAQQLPGDVAKYQQEIASVQSYLTELDRDAPLIRQRYQEIAAAKLSSSTGGDLAKEGEKFDTQIASLNELVAAYKQGGSTIAAANVSKEIEAARQKVADLAETYARFAAENPFDFPALAELAEGLANSDAQLKTLAADAATLKGLEIEAEIQKQTRAFQDQIPALAQLSNAYLEGADAVREAQVQLKAADFKGANPAATADQIKEVTALYQQQSDSAYAGSIAQAAAQYNLSESYSDEIEKLDQMREALQGIGASTLSVDAAIYDANEKNIEQWDEAALKVGSFADQMRTVFNQMEIEGQDFGGKVFSSMSKAVDDVSTQLAKLVVTGKSNFKQLFDSLAEQVAKAGFQRIFAQIAQPLAGGAPAAAGAGPHAPGGTAGTFRGPLGLIGSLAGIPGIKSPLPGGIGAGHPDGSEANPFYIVPVDAQRNPLTDRTGQTVGSTSIIGSLFNKPQSAGSPPSNGPVTDFFKSLGVNTGPSVLTPPILPSSNVSNVSSGPVTDFLSSIGVNSGPPAVTPPILPSSNVSNVSSAPVTDFLSGIGVNSGPPSITPPLPKSQLPSEITNSVSSIFGALGGSTGKIGTSITSIFKGIFGGFLAGGGDVSPGHAYIVGEKHPEFFMPGQRGTVAPSLKMQQGPTIHMGGIHVYGAADADSFQRSHAQIAARWHREAQLAFQRNG